VIRFGAAGGGVLAVCAALLVPRVDPGAGGGATLRAEPARATG